MFGVVPFFFFFFFNDTATTEIYTLSLHDALPISNDCWKKDSKHVLYYPQICLRASLPIDFHRSEEHTSELQSRPHLVCRLLLEKKCFKPTPTRMKLIQVHLNWHGYSSPQLSRLML